LPIKQNELDNLRSHIAYLKSPAGTEAPKMTMVDGAIFKSGLLSDAQIALSKDLGLQAPERRAKDIGDFLASKGYNVGPTAAQNLSLLARGVAVGAREAMLTAIGKDEFIKYAGYLAYRHGGYLPPAVDANHAIALDNVDLNGEYQELDKAKRSMGKDPITNEKFAAPKINRAGELKTKMVLMSPNDFCGILFGSKGYFEGWFYGANTLAGSQYLGRPLAAKYAELVNEGLQGPELRAASVAYARELLDALPQDIAKTMMRSTVSANAVDAPYTSWANALVDKLEGLASKPMGAIKDAVTRAVSAPTEYAAHLKLLDDIANGNLPVHVNDFYAKYAFDEKGNALERKFFPETVISRTPQLTHRGWVAKLATAGHEKALSKMVNYLSRQPTFIAEFVLERKALDEKVAKGIITADQADIMAETNATYKITRYIHNPSDKTKFEEMMRTVAPFYFAQNQAFRRMGRLFAENPGAFMQYAAAMWGVQTYVNKVTTANGISLTNLPAITMFGLPFTGSLSSLSTMDPFSDEAGAALQQGNVQNIVQMFAPKFGPIISVSTKLLEYWFPAIGQNKVGAWATNQLVGNIGQQESLSQFLFQSAVPNSVARNFAEGIVGAFQGGYGTSGDALSFMDNSYLQAETEALRYTIEQQGRAYWEELQKGTDAKTGKPLTGLQKAELFYQWQAQHLNPNTLEGANSLQTTLDAARQKAGLVWGVKMILGAFSPVSIGIGQADTPMIQKMNKYVTDPKYNGNYMAAIDQFTKDYPWATIDTVYKSKSTTGGYFPETKTMYDWLKNNEQFVQQHPLAALAFAPDLTKDTKYYQPAYTLLLQLGLRQRMTPSDFLNQFLTTSGNSFYYNWIRPQYEQYRTMNKTEAYKWKTAMVNWYGNNYNPTWLSNYNANTSSIRKLQGLFQLGSVLQDPKYGNTEIGKGLQAVYNSVMGQNQDGLYFQLQKAITSGKMNSVDAQDEWHTYMDSWIKSYPILKSGIMSLFYNLG
jgi:hypothetical protein